MREKQGERTDKAAGRFAPRLCLLLFDLAFSKQFEHIDRRTRAGGFDMQMGTERLLCIDRFRDRAERLACCDRLPRKSH